MGRYVALVVLMTGCGRLGFDVIPGDDARMTYREVVLADAPVGYWRLGDSGPAARDEVGGDDGAFSNGCERAVDGALVGDPDPAVGFDGTLCQIELGDQPQLRFEGTSTFSLEVWVRRSTAPNYYHFITRETRNSSAPIDGYALFEDEAPDGAAVERAVAGNVVRTPGGLLAPGRFVHVVGTYDGAELALFVDGNLVSSIPDTRTMATFTNLPLLGVHATGARFAGVMDEIAIYDHALAPARIALHHEIGVAGPQ